MKRLAIIITTLFALTAAASAESDPKKVAAILEGAKVCNATADPVACMTGFMAALGVVPSEEKAAEVVVESSDTAEVVVETEAETTSALTSEKNCRNTPSQCDNKKLCIFATSHSPRRWETKPPFVAHATYAKKRGLDCRVVGSSTKTTSSDVASLDTSVAALRTAFINRTRSVRKSIQSKLSELDYYKDNIDGKWGKNTQKALLNYATAKGMDTKDSNNLFSTILKIQTSSNSIKSRLPKCVGVKYKKWTDCQGTTVDDYNDYKYVGEWKKGKKHGQGILTWGSGAKYVGAFQKNEREGQGTMTYADGAKYVGEWVRSEMEGQGVSTWPNGAKYVGGWYNSYRYGQGTMTYANGDNYKGSWKYLGKFHGMGVFTYKNGDKIVGEFRKDKAYNTTFIAKKETKEEKCESLGFTKKTEPFGNCVLKLTELEALKKNKNVDTTTLNQNYSDIQKRESSAKKLQGLSQMLQGISDGLYGTSNSTQQQPTCFKKSQYTSGFNKICNYTCGVSAYSMTISKTQFCPFTTRR